MIRTHAMRTSVILLTLPLLAALAGCKPEAAQAPPRPIRAIVAIPKAVADDRQAVGEVKPRYESDLSFRVAGKLLARLVDVGAAVKQGDRIATLDTQDYQNRLRSAEADVSSAEAALVEAQGSEDRLARLLKNGFTPKANYDTALRNLRAAEARLAAAKANVDLTRDQLDYTELKAEFDGVITAVGAEAGQNVTPGQLVVRLARPGDKDAVFSIAETAIGDRAENGTVLVWPLSNPDLLVEGLVREVSPVADPTTRTYTVKVTLKDPPPQVRFGMSIGGRWKGSAVPVMALPLSALFEKNGAPAVWIVDQTSGDVTLKPVTVARYEADTVIIADGIATGNVIVTAGINMLRENQKVRLAAPASTVSTQ
jgi:RND family efflux transporter MFP subunit